MITHAKLSMPIQADGCVHIRAGDVIPAQVFYEALASSKTVERGSVVMDRGRGVIEWTQHLAPAMARALEQKPEKVSMGYQEEDFLGPQVLNTGAKKKP